MIQFTLDHAIEARMAALGLQENRTAVRERLQRLRQAIALPIYTAALILSFASDLLGVLAAKIAGDDWS